MNQRPNFDSAKISGTWLMDNKSGTRVAGPITNINTIKKLLQSCHGIYTMNTVMQVHTSDTSVIHSPTPEKPSHIITL